MMTIDLLEIVIGVFGVFIALGLWCAVAIALRRDGGVGRRCDAAAADPFPLPFGDEPWFSQRELDRLAQSSRRRMARDPLRRSFEITPHKSAGALRRVAQGGRRDVPSVVSALRSLFAAARR